jgi:hypothetical protein
LSRLSYISGQLVSINLVKFVGCGSLWASGEPEV